MKTRLMASLKLWLPLAFLATMLCGLVYGAVQQDLRQSANDPQIQMAEDAALAFAGGTNAQSLPLSGNVDIAQSLSPYLVFYDESGKPTGGNGLLNGQFPTLPSGVFAYTRVAGEEHVTWQPEATVRDAIVLVHLTGSQGGFVMAGRSLREVEKREDQLQLMVGLAWVVTLVGLLIVLLIVGLI